MNRCFEEKGSIHDEEVICSSLLPETPQNVDRLRCFRLQLIEEVLLCGRMDGVLPHYREQLFVGEAPLEGVFREKLSDQGAKTDVR